MAGAGRRVQEIARRVTAPPARQQPLIELDRPGLLEHVDHRVAVGADAQGAAGLVHRPAATDAVAEIAFGGRAQAYRGTRRREPRDVRSRHMGGMDRSRRRSEHAALRSQRGGREPGRPLARFVLGRLFRQVEVKSPPAGAGGIGDHRHRVRVDGAHAVDGRADAEHRGVGQRGRSLAPSQGVTVTEAPLVPAERLVEASAEITGVEQGQPDPGVLGRRGERGAHLVGVGVGPPVGLVMQVVELADGGDARQRHLRVGGAGQRQQRVGVEALGDVVHGVAPGPEVASLIMGPAAQGAVEGVGVGVGQARQRDAGQQDVAGLGVDAPVDRSDPVGVGCDAHAAFACPSEPRVLAVPRRHSPAIGMRMPRARATAAASG